MNPKLFLFAGEQSGDLLGAELISEIHKKEPSLTISGVGGPEMRKRNFSSFLPMEEFQVMGFIDVLFSLPKLIRLFSQMKNYLLKTSPKMIIFIDYPDFSLRMARSLRKHGFKGKLIQYVCPTIWAWRKKRLATMEKTLDLLLCILPFEPEYLSQSPLKAYYVGHPLLHFFHKTPSLPQPPKAPLVGIFPGSRKEEIRRNLPLQLSIAKKLFLQNPKLNFSLSLANDSAKEWIAEILKKEALPPNFSPFFLSPSTNSSWMHSITFAIATCGTITLELALHEVPTIVTYAISPIDRLLAKKIFHINLPFFSLPNILAKQEIFPELLGPHFTEENLLSYAQSFLENPSLRERCKEKCRHLRKILEAPSDKKEAATEILSLGTFE